MKGLFCLEMLAATCAIALVTTRAHASKSCTEVSDIVGYHKCTQFGGEWANERRPPLTLGIGVHTLFFSPVGQSFSAKATKHGPEIYSFEGDKLGDRPLVASGLAWQITGFLFPNLYLGVESTWAFGKNGGYSLSANGYQVSPGGYLDTFAFTGGILVGGRLPLGKLSLRPEMLIGGRVIALSQDATKDGETKRASASAGAWALEPRLVLDVWGSPWFSLSAFAGTDVLDPHSHSFGLMFLGHGRAYDGAFTL